MFVSGQCVPVEVTPWVTGEEFLNPCFPLDKRYAAVSGKHTKIDPEWPIAEVFIYESDYDDECQNRGNAFPHRLPRTVTFGAK